jgi:hypothetical protein
MTGARSTATANRSGRSKWEDSTALEASLLFETPKSSLVTERPATGWCQRCREIHPGIGPYQWLQGLRRPGRVVVACEGRRTRPGRFILYFDSDLMIPGSAGETWGDQRSRRFSRQTRSRYSQYQDGEN